jgi:hypothetical protein
MARKEVRGTGMTAREVIVWESAEDARRWALNWNAAIKAGGFFGAATAEAARSCAEIIASAKGDEFDDFTEDSLEDFARRIAKCLRIAQVEVAKGNADQAARYAWMAGVEWARASMKEAWQPAVSRGVATITAASAGGKQRKKLTAAKFGKRLARMTDLEPQVGPEKAAAIVAAEEGKSVKADSIKRWFNRVREK